MAGSVMIDRLDRIGRWVLIYEGAVLASRLVRATPAPAVSEVIWRLPRTGRIVVSAALCGYLAYHWTAGPKKSLDTVLVVVSESSP